MYSLYCLLTAMATADFVRSPEMIQLSIKMLFSATLFLAVLIVTSNTDFISSDTDSCEAMAVSGNCDFYSQCVEKRVPCGPDGYALGYGGKYCIKFGQDIDCFNDEV